MQKSLILFALLSLLGFSACKQDGPCVDSSGDTVTQSYPLSGFTRITNSTGADLHLLQDADFSVEASGPQSMIDNLLFEVSGDRLTISEVHCVRAGSSQPAIAISLPDLNELQVTGSGAGGGPDQIYGDSLRIISSGSGPIDITFQATKSIEMASSGSGNITAEFNCPLLTTAISGSGSQTVIGSAAGLDLSITGSGDFHGFNCSVSDAVIFISGSGDAEINVINSLNATLTGSGSCYYKGNPPILISATSGSGQLVDAN